MAECTEQRKELHQPGPQVSNDYSHKYWLLFINRSPSACIHHYLVALCETWLAHFDFTEVLPIAIKLADRALAFL